VTQLHHHHHQQQQQLLRRKRSICQVTLHDSRCRHLSQRVAAACSRLTNILTDYLIKYLEMDDDDDDNDDDDCLASWHRNKSTLNKLDYPAVHLAHLQLVLPLNRFLACKVIYFITSPHTNV